RGEDEDAEGEPGPLEHSLGAGAGHRGDGTRASGCGSGAPRVAALGTRPPSGQRSQGIPAARAAPPLRPAHAPSVAVEEPRGGCGDQEEWQGQRELNEPVELRPIGIPLRAWTPPPSDELRGNAPRSAHLSHCAERRRVRAVPPRDIEKSV